VSRVIAHRRPEALTAAFDALAVYRLTRLLLNDGIVDRPREAALARLRRRNNLKLVELIECPWCTGFWAAAGVVLTRRTAPRLWEPISSVLAFSAAAGLLASRVRSWDDSHQVTERIVDADEVSASTPVLAS
jgi:hypothetical protein